MSGKLKSNRTANESSPNTGPTCGDGVTCEPSHPKANGELTLFAAATPARPTALQAGRLEVVQRALGVTSSGLLKHFARELWSAKIRQHERMLPGLGSEFDAGLSRLVTLACPSDCEAAALGLTASGSECLCSPNWYSPTATDWKGGSHKERKDGGNRSAFRHQHTRRTGFLYPDPEVMEAVLGYQVGWTELDQSETVCRPASPSGSDAA